MDDDTLLRAFEDCSLPFEAWTHRAHVRIAFLYLRSHPFDEAADRVRRGLKAYNVAYAVPEGPLSGYRLSDAVFVRVFLANFDRD